MTTKQSNILNFIRRHLADYGLPPTMSVIATQFGVTKPSIHEHLHHLLRDGFLQVQGPAGRQRRYVPAKACPTCGGPYPR